VDLDPDPSITSKKSKKTLDFYYFVKSFDYLSLKIGGNVHRKKCYAKKTLKITYFLMASCQPLTEKTGTGFVSQWFGTADPDPKCPGSTTLVRGYHKICDHGGSYVLSVQDGNMKEIFPF
jgi:hypothetical protein